MGIDSKLTFVSVIKPLTVKQKPLHTLISGLKGYAKVIILSSISNRFFLRYMFYLLLKILTK
jgi:hypothetical protein